MSQLKARALLKDEMTIETATNTLQRLFPEGSTAHVMRKGQTGHSGYYSVLSVQDGNRIIRGDLEIAYLLDLSYHQDKNAVVIPANGRQSGLTLVQLLALKLYGDANAIRYASLA